MEKFAQGFVHKVLWEASGELPLKSCLIPHTVGICIPSLPAF